MFVGKKKDIAVRQDLIIGVVKAEESVYDQVAQRSFMYYYLTIHLQGGLAPIIYATEDKQYREELFNQLTK